MITKILLVALVLLLSLALYLNYRVESLKESTLILEGNIATERFNAVQQERKKNLIPEGELDELENNKPSSPAGSCEFVDIKL